MRLRENQSARKKIRNIMSELDLGSDVRYISDSGDSDEYIPEQTRRCGVADCSEVIFLGVTSAQHFSVMTI